MVCSSRASSTLRRYLCYRRIWSTISKAGTSSELLHAFAYLCNSDVRTHPPLLYSYPPPPSQAPGAEAKRVTCSSTSNVAVPKSATTKASLLDENYPVDGSQWSTKNVKHRSLYVALDVTRSDALSPSDLGHSPKKTKDASHSAMLPDRTLAVDIRSLNLHLALRAKEVVGCSESMWEWVEEMQVKHADRPRFRSDSIEVALLGSTTALNGHDADVLIKDVILEMTREDFDQILTHFQL